MTAPEAVFYSVTVVAIALIVLAIWLSLKGESMILTSRILSIEWRRQVNPPIGPPKNGGGNA